MVDLLIGLDYRHLQPAGDLARVGFPVGGLRLSESKFGCGWIVFGSHASLGISEHKLTSAARMLMSSVAAEPDANTNSHLPLDGGEGGDAGGLGGGNTELPTASVHLT